MRAEIVIDVATHHRVGTSVTLSVTGEEVVRLREFARAEFGRAPIALFFDNGSEHVNSVVVAWCHQHIVVVARGFATAREEAGLPFRDPIARDFRDVRNIIGREKVNEGLPAIRKYARSTRPVLLHESS